MELNQENPGKAPGTPSQPDTAPTLGRAVVCLLLNIVVFPGLGTLVSGQKRRKKTGVWQLGLGVMLIPMLAGVTVYGALSGNVTFETLKFWVGNFILILVLWNVITGIQIFRDSLKNKPPQSPT